ncbi:MAG: hypothetical protein ABI977_32820 [Acidobacteriota bacterium]
MTNYDENQTLRQARQRYFDDNHFGADGGYGDKWVQAKLGPLPIAIPNLAARVRAVRFHDLHHLATGYATDWQGEAEIAAWEIATGIGRHYAGWALDLWALAVGLFVAPRSVWRAFLRGRQTRNLFTVEYSDELLQQTVGALRRELGLQRPGRRAFVKDRLCFAGWAAVSLLWTLLSMPFALTIFPALAAYARLAAHRVKSV